MSAISAQELRENFAHFDSNGDGRIALHEFEGLMDAPGVACSAEEARPGFAAIDADGSSLIDYQEFASWFADR